MPPGVQALDYRPIVYGQLALLIEHVQLLPGNIQSKTYLEKRRKNNEAAKRSREKRRKQELHLEQRVMELKEENDNFIR